MSAFCEEDWSARYKAAKEDKAVLLVEIDILRAKIATKDAEIAKLMKERIDALEERIYRKEKNP